MSSLRVPSPARSQGVASPTPRKSRRTRSVCSATSSTSLRLTTVIQDSFRLSPMLNRKSVLNDESDIQIPGRQSWWRRIGDNSRNVTEIMEDRDNKEMVKLTNINEEFDVEILSQENENMSVDLPESSDGESIHSIIIPQRKMFTKQDNRPQKICKNIINNKVNLPKIRKSYFDETNIDQDINVMPKKLFNQGKPRTKPVFTAALLNESANKTVNKSIERPSKEPQGQVRNLFGNRPGTKRKNVFSAFLLSDSEDEIPDIQPKVFEFPKRMENQQTSKQQRRSASQSSVHSNMTDADMDEWQHLPSSTMVEHEFEAGETTHLKRRRSSRLTKPEQSEIATSQNNIINKSMQPNQSPKSNKSNHSNKSYQSNKSNQRNSIYTETEDFNIITTRSQSLNKSKNSSNIMTNNKSLKEVSINYNSKLVQNISVCKTLTEENMEVEEGNEKTLTEKEHSDEVDNEDFTLEYENDDYNEQIFNVNMKEGNNEQELNATNEEQLETEQEDYKSAQEEVVQSPHDENEIEQENIREQEEIVQRFQKENEIEPENVIEQDNESEQDNIYQSSQEEIEYEQQNQDVLESEHEEIEESNRAFIENQVREDIQSDAKSDILEYKKKQRDNNPTQIIENMDPKRIENDADHLQLSEKDYEQTNKSHKTNENHDKQVDSKNLNDNENEQENTDVNEQPNSTHDTTGRFRKDKRGVQSPEAVLHDKTNRGESFTTHGRNTSISKSKTMIKELNIRPSLCPARESTGLADSTLSSSVEGSGWDSHRTTRKTLRQTFGKDFTPRKSLRTLVMERSAKRQANQDQVSNTSKRQSNFNEVVDKAKQDNLNDITSGTIKKPMANSTEYPDFESCRDQEQLTEFESDIEHEHVEEFRIVKVQEQVEQLAYVINQEQVETGKEQEIAVVFESNGQQEQLEELESDRVQEQVDELESDRVQEQVDELESDREQEQVKELQSSTEQDEDLESDRKQGDLEEPKNREQEESEELETDKEQEFEESQSDKEQEFEESESEKEQEIEESESDKEQEVEESKSDKEQEVEESESEKEQEIEESESEKEQEVEESESEKEQEVEETESDKEQEQVKEPESDIDQDEELASDIDQEEVEESESDREQEQDEFESFREPQPMDDEESMEVSNHELSRQLRLNALERYLLKVKQEKAESRRKMQEQVMNSLKMARKPYNPFKMPEIPKQRQATKTIKKAAKPKPKPSPFSSGVLPPEFLEDMKYKPPKRFQGKNAPWITTRLYKYLEDKLEPNYDYRARVRAEKLVEKLYHFAKDVRKCRVAPPEAIAELKHEMARLGIVKTHHEFYCFFHEFMPREIRIRVNPDILNKIPAPKRVFANILGDDL